MNADASQAWAPLVDLAALRAWMDDQGVGQGPIEDVRALSGGTQNIILSFQRGAARYVLRRPPVSPYADGSETMRREARVLKGLANTAVPHPRLIADCPDAGVLGAAFYLMEAVSGFCASQGMPPTHAADPAMQHAMGLAVIDALAALRKVDPHATALVDFGRLDGFLERQVPRWLKQLDSYAAYEGWDGRADLPGVEKLAAWLGANLPSVYRPGLIHGDFHLGNLLFSPTGPEVAAIVDWEIATLGDPTIDLGCLLATWTDPDGSHPGCIPVEPWLGFPTEAELADRYVELTDCRREHVDWFVVLACFKLAILQEGTYARAAVGKADRATADWLHGASIKLLERALSRI